MHAAPRKIEQKAIRAACRYRDSEGLPQVICEGLRTKAQEALEEVCVAMGCREDEALMVSQNLNDIVMRTPRKKLRAGRDY